MRNCGDRISIVRCIESFSIIKIEEAVMRNRDRVHAQIQMSGFSKSVRRKKNVNLSGVGKPTQYINSRIPKKWKGKKREGRVHDSACLFTIILA